MYKKEDLPNIAQIFDDKPFPYFFEDVSNFKTEDDFTRVYGTGIDNIKYVENAISEEDIQEAFSYFDKYSIWDGRSHCYPLHMHADFIDYGKELNDYNNFNAKMGQKMIDIANSQWGENALINKDGQNCLMMVHPTGTYLAPHTDILDIHYENNDPDHDSGPTQEEQLKKWPNLWSGHLAILAYLNDDYGDGYLYFPDFDYYIKPKRGSVIMFPGGLHYVHGVTKITSGTRYTLSQWCLFDIYKRNW